MTDFRSDLLNRIQTILIDEVPETDLRRIADRVTILLNNYEIGERCTEISLRDNTSEQYLKLYLATKKVEGKSDRSLKEYGYQITRFMDRVGMPITDITPFVIRSYLAEMVMRGLKPATIDSVRGILVSYGHWLYDEGLVKENPVRNVAPVKVPNDYEDKFSNSDIDRIRTACKTVRERTLVEFMLSSGARASEVLSINRSDVDLVSRQIKILGKGNKYRVIYFDEVTAMYLKQYMEDSTSSDGSLFCRSKKPYTRIGHTSLQRICNNLQDRSGVDNVHPHRFRRTLATNLIARGVPIEKVSKILGHANLNTTMRYLAMTDNDIKIAYERGI